MANATQQIAFIEEYVKEFELKQSLIRDRVTTNAIVKGEVARFLVAGSGGADAVTRGSNGKIPSRNVSKTQKSATLKEKHDKQIETGFDMFASQGNIKQIMMDASMGVIYRDFDQDIITTLSTATVTTGTAAVGSINLINKAFTTLGNAKAGGGKDTITFLITPSLHSYLTELEAFSSAEYVDTKQFMTDATSAFSWRGGMFIEHPELPGVGTSSATCFAFNHSAVGHAYNAESLSVHADYDKEDDYSFVRATCYHGSVLLQNAGVVKIIHNDSGNSL